jgi:hypothetical protein
MRSTLLLFLFFEFLWNKRSFDKKISVGNSDESNTKKIEGSGAKFINEHSVQESGKASIFTLNSIWYIFSYNQDYEAFSNIASVDIDGNKTYESYDLKSNLGVSFYLSNYIVFDFYSQKFLFV